MDSWSTVRVAVGWMAAFLIGIGSCVAQTASASVAPGIVWSRADAPPAAAATWFDASPRQGPRPAQTTARPGFSPRRSRKWAIEVHGGRFGNLLSGSSSSGTGIESFPAGASFTTAGGNPSRAVSSWFYGDGPVLFDQIRASFSAQYGMGFPGITPLDGVLRAPATTRTLGNAVGGRFSRDLTSWLGLELAYDHGSSRTNLSDAVSVGVESTRVSYEAAFQGLLVTLPQNGGVAAATAALPAASGSRAQTVATASIVLTPIRVSRARLYLLAGGGIVKADPSSIEVRLQGGYRFSLLSQFPYNESESVTMRFSDSVRSQAGVVGAGLSLDLWGPLGIRAEMRVLVTEHTTETTLTSSNSHATVTALAQQRTLPSLTTPSIQFSNVPGARTTLGGEGVTDLVTYSVRGFQRRPLMSVGLVLRF